jgi:phosphotransferase system IIB component
MKRANIIHFLTIILSFSCLLGLNYYLTGYEVQLDFYNLNLNTTFENIVMVAAYSILMGSSLYLVTKAAHQRFIKHHKQVNLTGVRLYLLVASLLTAYSLIYFDLRYYYYLLTILLSIILYFIFLYLHDSRYVAVSQKSKVEINDELVTEFLKTLGGEANVLTVSYEYSRLKVELKDVKLVNLDQIKTLGATGVFLAGNKLQAIIGPNAQDFEIALKKYITSL